MTRGTFVVESTTTDEVAARERTDFWSTLVNSYHCACGYEFADAKGFQGRTIRVGTDSYQLAGWRATEEWLHRTPGLIKQDPDEDYRFTFPIGGELLVRQNGEQALLTPTAGSLFTPTSPYDIWHSNGNQGLILTIPRSEIDQRLNQSAPVGVGFDLTVGLGRVVRDLMVGLTEERATLTPYQFDAVCDRLVELLCMLVTGDDRPDAPGHLADVEAMVRRHVRQHAGDPELCGQSVARQLGWSLRQVQKALQHSGTTPRELIREERLRLVRERLQNPAYRDWTIQRLAHEAGFSSGSALSIAFRNRYGVPPRDLRASSADIAG